MAGSPYGELAERKKTMTREEAKNIVKGITDKIESTTDIDDWAEFWGFTREDYEEFLEMSIKALEQEPKKGHWIDCGEREIWYRCSECREKVWGGHRKYCPNCGAKMGKRGSMKTEIELFENALDTTSVNGKKLRKYINENYISNSALNKIIAGLKAHKWSKDEGSKAIYNSAIDDAITYIEKHRAESEKTEIDELDFIQPKKVVGKLISVEVLDKIRAEIEAYQSDAFYSDDIMMNKRMVLDIIDKYKAESEE